MTDIPLDRAQFIVAQIILDLEGDVAQASITLARGVASTIHRLNTLQNGGYRSADIESLRLQAGAVLDEHRRNQARLAALLSGLREVR